MELNAVNYNQRQKNKNLIVTEIQWEQLKFTNRNEMITKLNILIMYYDISYSKRYRRISSLPSVLNY